jgi:hypothetical protein
MRLIKSTSPKGAAQEPCAAKLIFEEFCTVELDIHVAVSRQSVASNWSVYAWSWHWYGSPGPLRKEYCEPNRAPYRALR